MTICEQCGAPTQPEESFCGSCGSYLEWQEPPADEAGPTGTDPLAIAASTEPTGREVHPDPVPAEGGERATPVVDVPPSAPAAVQPVRPGSAAPRPRRRELPVEDRRPQPGETVCPDCGAGNVPRRRFCRRCGADLVDAPVVPELPWYRRLFRRQPRPAPVAGTRPTGPRSRRRWGGRTGLVALLAVLLVAGWLARDRALAVVDLARDRFSNELVHATSFSASSQSRGHPASAVGDGAPNRYWSPGPTGPAEGESVTLGLEDPVRLAYVKVFNGPSSEPGKAYLATARLRQVLLTMTLAGGGVETQSIVLKDEPGGQDFHVGVDDVVAVQVSVVSSVGATGTTRVALGEVELFRRS